MENYDIIIIGAGIAGAGIAHNLTKMGYTGKMLIIDKKNPGANAAYGYRNTTSKTIKEYNIPYVQKYLGIKGGTEGETLFKLKKNFYLFDYAICCNKLIKNSNAKFKNEQAIKIGKNIIKTNKNIYKFKFIIDCSGHSFFTKNILNDKKPFRYWVGITRILENQIKDKQYFHYQFSDTGYSEDLYSLGNKTLQGDWQYSKTIDFANIKPPKKTLFKKIPSPKISQINKAVIPCTPTLPLMKKNIFYLGDSFGNVTTSSAEGITPILATSKILATAIINRDYKMYEKSWKNIYLDNYIKFLTLKYYGYNHSKLKIKIKGTPPISLLCKKFSKYPELFEKMLMCDSSITIPKEIQKVYPVRKKIFQLAYYTYLNLKIR